MEMSGTPTLPSLSWTVAGREITAQMLWTAVQAFGGVTQVPSWAAVARALGIEQPSKSAPSLLKKHYVKHLLCYDTKQATPVVMGIDLNTSNLEPQLYIEPPTESRIRPPTIPNKEEAETEEEKGRRLQISDFHFTDETLRMLLSACLNCDDLSLGSLRFLTTVPKASIFPPSLRSIELFGVPPALVADFYQLLIENFPSLEAIAFISERYDAYDALEDEEWFDSLELA
ncbi:ARID2 protein [Giardia muris]|uniref:ARID2 protein n=1 Tax=Giardia muris TaxID=5742 RepID=A0A4Z1T3E0_GIAMU|nr:ARID2 protein [Giardia muris]|eukprot:TNJ27577.1 ARID2 protein [Giardia muris]